MKRETMSEKEQVKKYYNAKTQAIIKKYGPGPRIHFHIGTFLGTDDHALDCGDDNNVDQLQQQLTQSQERTVKLAAQMWEAEKVIQRKRIMDVGCGLGGGAIFWAQQHCAEVTAVTCAAEHLPVIELLSTVAGVANSVETQLCDACEVSAKFQYDAVVAMESSCYFNRQRWFEKLSEIVKDDGYVCIEDVFMQETQDTVEASQNQIHKDKFDSYWKTNIGTVSEYVRCAKQYGFELEVQLDISEKTQNFWTVSIAWNKAIIANHCASSGNASQFDNQGDETSEQSDEKKPINLHTSDTEVDVGKLRESIIWHEYFFQLWQERRVQVHLLRFKKTAKSGVVIVDGEVATCATPQSQQQDIPSSSTSFPSPSIQTSTTSFS